MVSLDDALPLEVGARGEAVLDLQQRLAELDLLSNDPPGYFGEATRVAIAAFQQWRGIAGSGRCDARTWRAIVEAGYRLGSRLLYRQMPMQRGDDVAELQRRLSLLGFDPGRIDGIFGDQTATAVADFQRNAGLPADAMCGRPTVDELIRVASREETTQLVSSLHERLRFGEHGATASLSSYRIGVGEYGGFASGAAAVARALRRVAGGTLELHDPSPSSQAQAANAASLDCFVSLYLAPERSTCTIAYYKGFRYESVASKALAELVQSKLPSETDLEDGGICGMALPILRETQMPAIEVQLGSPSVVVQRTARLATVLLDCLARWVDAEKGAS